MARGKVNAQILSYEDASLPLYLKQIANTRLLSKADEAVLAKKIRKGNRKALDKLIRANLRFVVSVARNYQGQGMSVSDLVNEGNLGLMRAARRFDESKGFKFISYAVWWIRQAILSALAEQSRVVKMPLNRVSTIYKVGLATRELEQKLERRASHKEIAKKVGIEEEEARQAATMVGRHCSVDAPFQEGEDGALLDMLQDKNAEAPDMFVGQVSLRTRIEGILGTLSDREAEVVKLYFGIGCDQAHTLEEIGARYNLTRERVRQIKEKALTRLKHSSRNREFREMIKEY